MISLNNFQRILIKFGIWLGTGILICLVGITGVFADTYYTNYFSDIYYYDNNGSSISAVNTQWNESMQAYVSGNIKTVANSYGAGVGFNSPIQLIKGHTYTFSISFIEIDNIALSSKKNIALGSGPYNSGYNYTQNNFKAETIMSSVTKGNIIQYSFTVLENANYIFMPWTTTTTVTQSYVFTQIIIDDLGSSGVSQQDINNSLNNQTTILNNSINNSTNTITQNDNSNRDIIINNQNQNKQDIIDNQNANNEALIDNNNKNTQDLIDDNKKNFQTCRDSYNLIDMSKAQYGKWVNTINGNVGSYGGVYLTDYIDVDVGKTYFFSGMNKLNRGNTGAMYDSNKEFVLGILNDADIRPLTIPNNVKYIRLNIWANNYSDSSNPKPMLNEGSTALDYEPYGEEICVNKLDEQNKQLNDLNDALNDDDSSGATNEASDFFSNFNTNTFGLTSIITAPLNLIQSLTSSSCSELHLPLPYLENKYLDLPCMTTIYQTHFGTFFTMYQTITYGIIAYWVCVRIFNQVKDFKNPEHDEIEVVDL